MNFHPSEMLAETYHVPEQLQIHISEETSVMKGTEKYPIRCTALEGQIGTFVRCTIYERRPSPCRRFQASYENGKKNPRCDFARTNKGLKPLSPRDWREEETQVPLETPPFLQSPIPKTDF